MMHESGRPRTERFRKRYASVGCNVQGQPDTDEVREMEMGMMCNIPNFPIST